MDQQRHLECSFICQHTPWGTVCTELQTDNGIPKVLFALSILLIKCSSSRLAPSRGLCNMTYCIFHKSPICPINPDIHYSTAPKLMLVQKKCQWDLRVTKSPKWNINTCIFNSYGLVESCKLLQLMDQRWGFDFRRTKGCSAFKFNNTGMSPFYQGQPRASVSCGILLF